MKFKSVTIKVKAIEQYFTVMLFIMLNKGGCYIMLYKVVPAFHSMDEILEGDQVLHGMLYTTVLQCNF